MRDVTREIAELQVPDGALGIVWLAQAGFIFKTPAGRTAVVDPYLSDSVERLHGFKRVMASPLSPAGMDVDLYVCTHEHADHLDMDTVAALAPRPGITWAGTPSCQSIFDDLGVPPTRRLVLREGDRYDVAGLRLEAVYADHGVLSPDPVGVILDVDGIRVYHMGDTSYHPEKLGSIRANGIDVIIPPINGAFGNLTGQEAAWAARDVGARVAIPCHFWMFVEHNGDPAAFLAAMGRDAPEVRPTPMTQGEIYTYVKRDHVALHDP